MDKMIKGTETEKSLLKAFAGESQAKNRYTFFSEIAKKEGYEQIAGIFYETALQEEMHAKRFFSYLEGGMLEITAAYPAGALLDTLANLPTANTTRLSICIRHSGKLPKRKASKKWPQLLNM